MNESYGKSKPPLPVLGKWNKDRSLRWQIEFFVSRVRDLANRIKTSLFKVQLRQLLKGKGKKMNDINWGGRVNNGVTIYFTTNCVDGTPINMNFTVGTGYYAMHVAAAFVTAWNNAIGNSPYLAVADENMVRFPSGNIFNAPRVFTVGTNTQTLPEGGGVLTIVSGLKVRTAEADF